MKFDLHCLLALRKGVTQDSIQEPSFFLVYINDLTENLNCNGKGFADDTSLFKVVENSHVNEVFQLNLCTNMYGDMIFTHDQNRQILESALKFIHSSERFL